MRLFSINQGSSEGETPSLAEVLADEATTPTSTLESEPEAARSALDGEAPAENLDAETPFADFESEFAALEIVPVAELLPSEDAPPVNATELEEWSEPLPSIAPLVLAAETVFQAHDGVLIIEAWLEARGGENIYRASWQSAGEGESQIVRLREASGVWAERLVRETLWRTQWEKAARLAMLPRLVCGLTEGDLTYLATEVSANGPTFAEFFALKAAKPVEERAEHETVAFLSETLLLLTQVAAFLVRLHGAGFAHLGLRPDGIVSGKPVQILDCSFAAPLGEALEAPLSIAGYSAPELAHPGTVDARSDLYSVGALLYRAVTGADIPESGADFTTWAPQVVIAGVPQILRRTLGAIDTRFSSAEELHRALVKLKIACARRFPM